MIRTLLRLLELTGGMSKTPPRKPSRTLFLEILPDRIVPATLYFNPTGASGSYDNAQHWFTDAQYQNPANTVPAAADSIVLAANKNCEMESNRTIAEVYLSSGSITTGTHTFIITNRLQLDGGTFYLNSDAASVQVSGVFTWSSASSAILSGSSNEWGTFWIRQTGIDGASVTGDGTRYIGTRFKIGNDDGNETALFTVDLDVDASVSLGTTGDIMVGSRGTLVFACTNNTNDPEDLTNAILASENDGYVTNFGSIRRSVGGFWRCELPVLNQGRLFLHGNNVVHSVSQSGSASFTDVGINPYLVVLEGYSQSDGALRSRDNLGVPSTATIVGNVTISGGSFYSGAVSNPGASITFYIEGNLTLGSGSTFVTRTITNAGDLVEAEGTITISDGALLRIIERGLTAPEYITPILIAGTSRTGTFVPANSYMGETGTTTIMGRYTVALGGVDNRTVQLVETNRVPMMCEVGNQNLSEGNQLAFTAEVEDSPGDILTWSLDQGVPAGATLNSLTGEFSWTPTDNGVFYVTIRVTDAAGETDYETILITVDNVAPTATFGPSGTVTVNVSATIGFTNIFDPSSADTSAGFTYSYDWNNDGDFTDDGEFSDVSAAAVDHVFSELGSTTIHGRIKDKDGGFTDFWATFDVEE